MADTIRDVVSRIRAKPIPDNDKVALLVSTVLGLSAEDARNVLFGGAK